MHWNLFFELTTPFFLFCAAAAAWDWIGEKIFDKWGNEMKNLYIAVQVNEDEKYYAYIIKVSECDNLLSKLKIPGIISANAYQTRKQAAAVVEAWRDAYRTNGNYMFNNF